MKTLVAGQQVKTPYDKYQPVITIGTVGSDPSDIHCDEHGNFDWDVFTDWENKWGRDSRKSYAWGNQHGAMICSDYEGKEQVMEKKRQAYEDAVLLEDGEQVLIDGNVFMTTIIERDVSDKIHFRLSGQVDFK